MHQEEAMCLSTAYMNSGNEQKEIMKDIARIEAEGQGFWLINLFGEKKFVEGSIQSADLLDGRFILASKGKVV
jgi:predicted RNA-binding protein